MKNNRRQQICWLKGQQLLTLKRRQATQMKMKKFSKHQNWPIQIRHKEENADTVDKNVLDQFLIGVGGDNIRLYLIEKGPKT